MTSHPARSENAPPRSLLPLILCLALLLALDRPSVAQYTPLVPSEPRDIGSALSISGNYLIIGAPGEARTPGVAFISRRTGATPLRGANRVLSPDLTNDPGFGRAVDIRGEVAAIGAGERVHVFELEPEGDWLLSSVLESPRVDVTATFGSTVAVGDGRIAVSDTWIDGHGAVYIYERSGDAWLLVTTILPNGNSTTAQRFGRALAFAGDDLLISGLTGDFERGTVFVYRKTATESDWVLRRTLIAGEDLPEASFGAALAGGLSYMAIGAPASDESASGAVLVLELDVSGGDWEPAAILAPDPAELSPGFGASVALADGTLLVGAPGSTTVSGRAYTYSRALNASWRQTDVLTADDPSEGEAFARAVALDGPRAVLSSLRGGGTIYDFVPETTDGGWRHQLTTTRDQMLHRRGYGRAVAADGGLLVVGGTGSEIGVHVFELEGPDVTSASQQAVLVPPEPSGRFGRAIATDGRQIAVGQEHRAYVYEKADGAADAWRISGQLAPPRTVNDDGGGYEFGTSIAIDDWIAVVGRWGWGPAHVFEKDDFGAWQHVSLLEVPESQISSFDIDGQYIAVTDLDNALTVFRRGNWGEWQSGPRISFSLDNFSGGMTQVAIDGSTIALAGDNNVWIYERSDANEWEEVQQFETRHQNRFFFFRTLDLKGDRLIIGSLVEDGDLVSEAEVYHRGLDGVWRFYHRIVPPAEVEGDHVRLGGAVAIDGDVAILGGNDIAYAFDVSASTVAAAPEPGLPGAFTLHGNYPNPFNPSTTIAFDLSAPAEVAVEMVDVLGRQVLFVEAGTFTAGSGHTVSLDASTLPSGTYLYRLRAGDTVRSGTMTLVR